MRQYEFEMVTYLRFIFYVLCFIAGEIFVKL